MTVKLNNGKTFDAQNIIGNPVFYQNAERDSLEFVFSKAAYSLEEIDKAFTAANCSKIVIDGENIYQDYTLRVKLVSAPVVVQQSTPDQPEVTEDQITVTMAQKTYIEKQLERLMSK